MPIIYEKEVNPSVSVAIWHITEPVDEIFPKLDPSDKKDVKDIFLEKKKLETIATRLTLQYLVNSLGHHYRGTIKDHNGKPHLVDHENIHISISHAYPYAAAIIDLAEPTGIDIELPREQIQRIKHKFLSEKELQDNLDNDLLTKFWCAKECLYKIHGRRSLIFSRHLHITTENSCRFIGRIAMEQEDSSYEMICDRIKDHWLVFKSKRINP